jgi:chromosome segregation ATPase
MGKQMNELGHVEEELAKLHSHLEKSFGILDGLAEIQSKFEELGQTYRQLQDYAEKSQTNLEQSERVEQRIEQRCVELETLMESRISGLRSEMESVRNELERSKGNVQDLDRLKNEVEAKVGSMLRDWTGSNDEIQAPIKELDARLNHLDTRTHMARTYMQQMEKQMKTLQGGMIFALVAAIASIGLAILNWSSNPAKNASTPESSSLYDVNGQPQNN